MARSPLLVSAWLTVLNGREPKNPRRAERGLGCAELTMWACGMNTAADCASLPHNTATSRCCGLASRARNALSVTSSQPRLRCDPACSGCTLSTRFRSKTPCSLHRSRTCESFAGVPRSLESSAKMFARLRGIGRVCGLTAKASPIGCPGVGYGSWPRTTTRTWSKGSWKARRRLSGEGINPLPASTSFWRNSASSSSCP